MHIAFFPCFPHQDTLITNVNIKVLHTLLVIGEKNWYVVIHMVLFFRRSVRCWVLKHFIPLCTFSVEIELSLEKVWKPGACTKRRKGTKKRYQEQITTSRYMAQSELSQNQISDQASSSNSLLCRDGTQKLTIPTEEEAPIVDSVF